jgi:hypothetical protein
VAGSTGWGYLTVRVLGAGISQPSTTLVTVARQHEGPEGHEGREGPRAHGRGFVLSEHGSRVMVTIVAGKGLGLLDTSLHRIG